jgi:hypothetical protein
MKPSRTLEVKQGGLKTTGIGLSGGNPVVGSVIRSIEAQNLDG